MKKLVWISIVSFLIFSLTACTGTSKYDGGKHQSDVKISAEGQQIGDNKNTELVTPKESEIIYAKDDVVNRFISEFNDKTKYEMTDISKGNIKTKFFAYADDCYIEMLNANNATAECFSISITNLKDPSNKDKMFDMFAETIKVLDPSVTEEKIAAVVNHLKEKQYMVNDYVISDKVTVKTYVPSNCRIDVISNDYK